MSIIKFPPVEDADEHGLLALGGLLNTRNIIEAYSLGIFPWPLNDRLLAWFAPPERAVLYLEKYHASKRLIRIIKQKNYTIKINKNFEKVIRQCSASQNRKGQKGTWITKDMINAYIQLHHDGYAHSIECYIDNELCGGVYGVSIGKMFAGESMFYTEPNASQIAFYHLVEFLKSQDVILLDCQVMTPHSKKFGAEDISREKFNQYLKKAIKEKNIDFTEAYNFSN